MTVMTFSARCGYFADMKRAEDAVLATMSADASRAIFSYRSLRVFHATPLTLGGAASSLVQGSRKSVISLSDVDRAISRAASCAIWGGPELMTHSYSVTFDRAMP